MVESAYFHDHHHHHHHHQQQHQKGHRPTRNIEKTMKKHRNRSLLSSSLLSLSSFASSFSCLCAPSAFSHKCSSRTFLSFGNQGHSRLLFAVCSNNNNNKALVHHISSHKSLKRLRYMLSLNCKKKPR